MMTLNAITVYSIYEQINSLHEVIGFFLFYNATLQSSAVVEHYIAVETNWLTKHSTVDCCCLNRIKLVNCGIGRCR